MEDVYREENLRPETSEIEYEKRYDIHLAVNETWRTIDETKQDLLLLRGWMEQCLRVAVAVNY